ncbi:MAG: hypothetical protein HUJ98_08120 [Bacteroidaceae bacterium]|nr:hypothetical protein [Bacteroidaceae bacterium]
MTFDYFKIAIIFCFGLLIAWGLAAICSTDDQQLILGITVAVAYLLAAIGFGIKVPEYPRTETNIRATILSVLVLTTIMDIVFAFCVFSPVAIIIPNGLLALTTMLIVRSILNSKG